MSTSVHSVAASEYVLLTTFRKNGDAVSTPVWIAPDGDDMLVTTSADSSKVKRLRNNPRVTLTPCDMSGRVKPGAQPVEATAAVRDDDETRARLDRALAAKYRAKYTMLRASRKLRRGPDTSVPLVISSTQVV